MAADHSRTDRALAQLLAELRRAPDDEELLGVLGDRLHDRGDARGELIALSLAMARPGPSSEARRAMWLRGIGLHRQHRSTWLSGLPVPEGALLWWRRGFVVGVAVRPDRAGMGFVDRLSRHPVGALLGTLRLRDPEPLGSRDTWLRDPMSARLERQLGPASLRRTSVGVGASDATPSDLWQYPAFCTFDELPVRTVQDNPLDLPVRTTNMLHSMGIRHLHEVVGIDDGLLLRHKGWGRKARNELFQRLWERGLPVGLGLDPLDLPATLLLGGQP